MTPDLQNILSDTSTMRHAAWLSKASSEAIDEYLLNMTANTTFRHLALAERERRFAKESDKRHQESVQRLEEIHGAVKHLSKAHPVHKWGLVVAILTLIFAAIAAWPIIHDWFWHPGK